MPRCSSLSSDSRRRPRPFKWEAGTSSATKRVARMQGADLRASLRFRLPSFSHIFRKARTGVSSRYWALAFSVALCGGTFLCFLGVTSTRKPCQEYLSFSTLHDPSERSTVPCTVKAAMSLGHCCLDSQRVALLAAATSRFLSLARNWATSIRSLIRTSSHLLHFRSTSTTTGSSETSGRGRTTTNSYLCAVVQSSRFVSLPCQI